MRSQAGRELTAVVPHVYSLPSFVLALPVMSVGLLKCKVCNHCVITTLNPVYHLVFTGRCDRGKQCIENYKSQYMAMLDTDSLTVG